ncbi:Nitrogen fixation protein of unknown function [Methylomagnum ishizawai]|uniref:Uncharacterized protein n=1 Tax=Methylomagnum ishizawai TaxID=1760988 RepID=A0A1Y6D8F9_9GAMM|nr:Nif11 family protein [Methylomagnum ishizawai]SMF96085.1 Nitrogen fixation protein of unknown function [Methylomagnum ishizawai]
MPDTAAILDALRHTLQQDPALQDRLFALEDPDAFAAALARLGGDTGQPIAVDALLEAMRQGRREWIERDMPW